MLTPYPFFGPTHPVSRIGRVALVALAAGALPASAFGAEGVVVYRFSAGSDQLQASAARLTDDVLLVLDGRSGIAALGESEIAVIVQHEEDRETLLGCRGRPDCAGALAKITETELILTGHVARWGPDWVATLALSRVGRTEVARASCAQATEAGLRACVKDRALELVGASVTAPGAGERPAALSTERSTRMAVIRIEPHAPSLAPIAKDVTHLFALELDRRKNVNVIGQDEVEKMVKFALDRAECLGDEALACFVEIGGALGVDYLATGAVGKLGETFLLHLKLIDVVDAKVEHRVLEEYVGEPSELRRAIRFATGRLLGRPVDGSGRLIIELATREAALSLDGAPARPLAADREALDLVAGKHALTITAEEHHPMYRELYVEPDGLTRLRAQLEPLPVPAWYERWWVWTIAGVAVAAGAASIAVVASTGGPDNGRIDGTAP